MESVGIHANGDKGEREVQVGHTTFTREQHTHNTRTTASCRNDYLLNLSQPIAYPKYLLLAILLLLSLKERVGRTRTDWHRHKKKKKRSRSGFVCCN